MLLNGNYCVGVFDSGLGGITILRQLQRKYPWCNYVYFADSAHCPYGVKPPHFVLQRAQKALDFLQSIGTDAIVTACNTASVHIDKLRTYASVPVYEVIKPTCAAAMQATDAHRIALLATDATVIDGEYQRILTERGANVHAIKCSALVPFAEHSKVNGAQCRSVADALLHNLPNLGCDAVILGCTHFPLLLDVLKPYCNGAKIVQCTTDFIPPENIVTAQRGTTFYYTSGNALRVTRCARRLSNPHFVHVNV